jgi:hypothetical protein
MNINAFLDALEKHPTAPLGLKLPNGDSVPAHFHITEVGHVTKRFIDCGGTRRVQETCLLQTWVHDDTEHRLLAGKLAEIFKKAGDIIPTLNLPVEIEHEETVVAQFPVVDAEFSNGVLLFQLGAKHTDCLARGICLPNTCAPEPAPKLKITVKTQSSCCTPSSACC